MQNNQVRMLAALTVAASLTAWADGTPTPNSFWWPDTLDLTPLRHAADANPLGEEFDYAKAFATLDLDAVKKDLKFVLTNQQPWWPADYGNYGPFFIRMAWHGAGTYRTGDGRGGAGGAQQRFEPLNSWPDNVNLDKARRLIWPIKQKYGRKISWADLMVLTGNVALESMGFETYGFGGGRKDDWEPELVYWGPEKKMLGDERHTGERKLEKPLAAVQMGLIYVNPEGPNGKPDPLAAAKDIRENFGRMAMNDEETVALIAGGHTFGKAHGAYAPAKCVGVDPSATTVDAQGIGWQNKCGTGKASDAVTSGLEGAWSGDPTKFTMNYFTNLFDLEWVQTKSPAGAIQWAPANGAGATLVPDPSDPKKRHAPMMFTTDLALKFDPAYKAVCMRFREKPEEFRLAFAKAWFKLTHRDMGPRGRYLGKAVPAEAMTWQDPLPANDKAAIDEKDASAIKSKILASGLTGPQLVRAAWASASTFRGTDMRGGANGARLRLAPQKDWAVNDPKELATVLTKLEGIRQDFNKGGKGVSLADVIVLGGNAAIEQAAKKGGVDVQVPFTAGRTDGSAEQTDAASFAFLEPSADAFRNYFGPGQTRSPAQLMVDRAAKLTLSVPEMAVLVGGMRVLNANAGQSAQGVLTSKPGTLSNDFFVNLLDMSTVWSKAAKAEGVYEGKDRASGKAKWSASPVDLIFGSNSELRAVSEVYASADAKEKFAKDFVKAWAKVSNLDRFDVAKN